jgi:Fe-S cluster assembly iron-binding protein IscA
MSKSSSNNPTLASTLTIIAICTAAAYYFGGEGWAIGIAIATAIGGFSNLSDAKNKPTTSTQLKKTTANRPQIKNTTPKNITPNKITSSSPSIYFNSISSDTVLTGPEAKKLVKQYLADNTKMDNEEIQYFIEDFSEEMKEHNEELREDINGLKEESAEKNIELKEAKAKLKVAKKSYTEFMKVKIDYDEEKDGDKFYEQDDKENELMVKLEDTEDEINSLSEDIEDNKKEVSALREKISAHTANKSKFTVKYINDWKKNEREYD